MRNGPFIFVSLSAPLRRAFRCLPLLHDHAKREELLEVLIDAGESAWARGAHEVPTSDMSAGIVSRVCVYC